MQTDKSLLPLVKDAVTQIIPDAKVLLFGSRVTGKTHDESDWDFLILNPAYYSLRLNIGQNFVAA